MIARGLPRRALALAAVALVGAVIALSAGSLFDRGDEQAVTVPEQVPVPGVGWYTALAAPYPASSRRQRTACGHRLGPNTLGVAHPVLPCGVDLVLEFDGVEVPAEVIARGPFGPGREFDLTQTVADDLGLDETTTIRWRFAG